MGYFKDLATPDGTEGEAQEERCLDRRDYTPERYVRSGRHVYDRDALETVLGDRRTTEEIRRDALASMGIIDLPVSESQDAAEELPAGQRCDHVWCGKMIDPRSHWSANKIGHTRVDYYCEDCAKLF